MQQKLSDSLSKKPIPFVTYDPKKGFVISEEAEQFLLSLNPERKLGVISIVGKYRTGKSFFINRVLLNIKNGGFNVGHTVNACTKGIWIWNDVIQPDSETVHKDMDILLLDTEGFGDTEENTTHDSRIFLFSLLLCSFFIYNSVGNIDENALNGVSLIINLAKNIQVKNAKGAEQEEDPAIYFPSFLWVVRDFALQMVDKQGESIKDKDYLEKALEPQKGVSEAIESKNRLRRLFKHFFKDRDCCTLVRPMEHEGDLQKVNEKDDVEFRSEFLSQIKVIRKKILKKINPKILNGKTFNGEMLLELTKVYIKTMNSGNLPNIDSAWQYLVKSESKKAMTKAVDEVEKEISEFIKSPHPQDLESVKSIKSKLQTQLFNNFRRKALGDNEDLQEMMNSLNQDFKSKFKKVKEYNMNAWKNKYQEYCKPKFDEIEEKLKYQNYSNYFEFQNDFNKLKEDFDKNGPKGPNKEEFFKEISERIYNLAAEHISRKTETILNTETRRLTLKLEMTENELNEKKSSWEIEKIQMEKRLSDLERENIHLEAKNNEIQEKFHKTKEDFQELKENYEKLHNFSKEKELNFENKMSEYKQKVESKFEKIKNEHTAKILEIEKEKSSNFAENLALKRENEALKEKIHHLQSELEKNMGENQALSKKNKKLSQKIDELQENNSQSLATMKLNYEMKIREMQENREVTNTNKQQITELLIKNTFLENNIKQLEGQLQESKRIYDNLFRTLQNGFENKGQETSETKDLLATNRALSLSFDSLEQRAKLIEIKNKKLKKYKKIVKSSTLFRCNKCAEFFLPHLFFEHLQVCSANANISNPSNSSTSPKPNIFSKESSSNEFKMNFTAKSNNILEDFPSTLNSKVTSFQKFRETTPKPAKKLESYQENARNTNDLKISIRQTNVQNGEDNKPFTEYTIFCNWRKVKWRIAKKYINFCQLNQELKLLFPNLSLQNANYIVSNTSSGISNVLDLKKPLLLEEKRKGLENYLREIAENDVLRNSQPFKKFLMFEEAVKKFSEPEEKDHYEAKFTKFSTPGPKSQEKIREVFISEKKNGDFYEFGEKEKENVEKKNSLANKNKSSKNEKIVISHNINDVEDFSSGEDSGKDDILEKIQMTYDNNEGLLKKNLNDKKRSVSFFQNSNFI